MTAIDLHLRVSAQSGSKPARLNFELSSPSGKHHIHRIKAHRQIARDPQPFSRKLFESVEDLSTGFSIAPATSDSSEGQQLRRIGKHYFETLVPERIQQVLNDAPGGSLLVETDEFWIPWELLHTHGTDGDFLCIGHAMSRWVDSEHPAIRRFRFEQILTVDAISHNSGWQNPSEREVKVIGELASRHGIEHVEIRGEFDEVLASLEKGGSQLIHVAAHSRPQSFNEAADRAGPLLNDRVLTPIDLTDGVNQSLRKDRPLVFLNACGLGRGGETLAGPGGWPDSILNRGRCGGLVAAQWPVSSRIASEVAIEFYRAADRGESLTTALRTARKQVIDSHGLDPSVLAYTIYCHPAATLSWGNEGDLEQDELPPQKTEMPRDEDRPSFDSPRIESPTEEQGWPQGEQDEGQSHSLEEFFSGRRPAKRPSSEKIDFAPFLESYASTPSAEPTDLDKDRFADQAFDTIYDCFEKWGARLANRPNYQCSIGRPSQDRISVTIYNDGRRAASCRIWRKGSDRSMGFGDILYANGDTFGNSINESLSVESKDGDLGLRTMGFYHSPRSLLSQEDAARHLWDLLTSSLESSNSTGSLLRPRRI